MTTNVLVANGTLTLNDRVFTDFADGDTSAIAFSDDLFTSKTGKGGNTIWSKNEPGRNAVLTLRVIRTSGDDQWLQNRISQSKLDFVGTRMLNGQLTLRVGDGQSNVKSDVYTLLAGMITRQPDGKENVEGDTAQGLVAYTIKFGDCNRSIQ